jgi:hypothetical protein
MEESLNRSRSYRFTVLCVVPALLRGTPAPPQTLRRHQWGAHTPPPVHETESANPLAAEASSLNRAFPFSRRSERRASRIRWLSNPPDLIRSARSTNSFTLLFGAFRGSV